MRKVIRFGACVALVVSILACLEGMLVLAGDFIPTQDATPEMLRAQEASADFTMLEFWGGLLIGISALVVLAVTRKPRDP